MLLQIDGTVMHRAGVSVKVEIPKWVDSRWFLKITGVGDRLVWKATGRKKSRMPSE